jgi:hypothetical protein
MLAEILTSGNVVAMEEALDVEQLGGPVIPGTCTPSRPTAAAEPFAYAVRCVNFFFTYDDTGLSCMPTKLGGWVCSNCWWLLLLFPADLPVATC